MVEPRPNRHLPGWFPAQPRRFPPARARAAVQHSPPGWGLGRVLPATPADPTIGADPFGRGVSAR